MRSRAQRPVPAVLLVLGGLACAAWAWRWVLVAPYERVVGEVMADDGLYYLVLSRDFPGRTFGAGPSTTGFHPMLWALLAPVAALPHAAAPRAQVLLLLALHVTSGVLLAALLARHLGRGVAAFVGATWMVNPWVRSIAATGVEASLSVVLVLTVALASTAPPSSRWRHPLVLGALVGLTFLARYDAVITAALLVAWTLLREPRPWRNRWTRSVLAGLAATIVASPWLLVLLSTGHLVPDSARAERFLTGGGGVHKVGRVVRFVGVHLERAVEPLAPAWAVLAAAAALALLHAARSPAGRAALVALAPLGVGPLVQLLAAALVTGFVNTWYGVLALTATWVLVFGPAAHAVAARLPPLASRAAPALSLVVIAVLGVAMVGRQDPFDPGEVDLLRGAAAVRRTVPPEERLGVWNAGLVSWELPGRVVNLDGLVNPAVHPALQAGRVCPYLREARVRWVLDNTRLLDALAAEPGVLVRSRRSVAALDGRPRHFRAIDLMEVDTAGCPPLGRSPG